MTPLQNEILVYDLAVKPGWIEIRQDGSVWRLKQRRKSRWDGTVTVKPVTPHRIDPSVGAGYRLVKLMVDGVQYSCLAHRLVWHVLHGPIPDGLTINHKNGQQFDNNPSNLELATYSDQTRHLMNTLHRARCLDQDGTRNAMARLTEDDVRMIRERRAAGERLMAIAADYGITDRNVSKIARRTRWKKVT